jgi:hypothetical protein
VAAQDRLLTLHDVSPDLARLIGGTELDFVAKAKIGYGVTGKSQYDQFFRESAVSYGGMTVGRGLTYDATIKLKVRPQQGRRRRARRPDQEITGRAAGAVDHRAVARRAAGGEEGPAERGGERVHPATSARVAVTIPWCTPPCPPRRAAGQVDGLVSGAPSAFGMLRAAGMVRNVSAPPTGSG